MEGFPMRTWNISVYLIDDAGNDIDATIFEKVTYKLHPTFGKRANQSMSSEFLESRVRTVPRIPQAASWHVR